jgi:hypothetical protein
VVTCTVVDGCSQPAVLQSVRDCTGCADTATEIETRIEAREGQVTSRQGDIARLLERCREEYRDPSDTEVLVLRQMQQELADLGAELEQLLAAAAGIAGAHQHPVYACADHVAQLPS